MSQESPTVEERIILATIDCIEKYGLQGTTNRRIAALAGVNGAAINYYFRSKEALIDRVMKLTLQNAFDTEDFSRIPAHSAQEKCIAIFSDLLQGACNFPGITYAHYQAIVEGRQDSLAVKKLNEFLVAMVQDLSKLGVDLAEKELRLAVAQIAAAVMMLSLNPDLFKDSFGLDLCDEKVRADFIRRLVEKLLG